MLRLFQGAEHQEKGLTSRLARKFRLPVLVCGPAIALALLTPSVAFGAVNAGTCQSTLPQGTLTVSEEVYSTESASPSASQTKPVASQKKTRTSEKANSSQYEQKAEEGSVSASHGAGAASSAKASTGAPTKADQGAFASSGKVGSTPTVSQDTPKGNDIQNNSSYQLLDSNKVADSSSRATSLSPDSDFNETAKANLTSSDLAQSDAESLSHASSESVKMDLKAAGRRVIMRSPAAAAGDSSNPGTIVFYDSHKSDITYTAGTGGTIASGLNTTGIGTSSITEHFDDSLSGTSTGFTALPNSGFHFVNWIDQATGEVVCKTASYLPERPEEGWAKTRIIQAIFARNTYLLILDANGGTATSGGIPSEQATFTVIPGSNYVIPANGGSDLTVSRKDCALTGWNVSRVPSNSAAGSSYALADGATLTAAVEAALQSMGALTLDWTQPTSPALVLYAQWGEGQTTISYRASDGGAVSLHGGNPSRGSVVSENLSVSTGARSDGSADAPQGASAIANRRYHFTGWTVSGSTNTLQSAEATSSSLSGTTVARLSKYVDAGQSASSYHPLTFTASFAPNAYKFSYKSNGGMGSVKDALATYGSTTALANPGLVRSGYTLKSWNTAQDGSGRSFTLGKIVNADLLDSLIGAGALMDQDGASLTLYAQWEKKPGTSTNGGGSNPGTTNGGNSGTNGGGNSGSNSGSKGSNSGTSGSNTGSKGSGSKGGTTSKPGTNSGASGSQTNSGSTTNGGTTHNASSSAMKAVTKSSTVTVTRMAEVTAARFVADIFSTDNASEAASDESTGLVPDELGSLASDSTRDASSDSPIVIAGTNGSSSATGAYGGSGGSSGGMAGFLSNMTASEAVGTVSNTVTAVAAVGAVGAIVGIGVSVAGGTVAGATAIGAAATAGLSSAADLAADVMANASRDEDLAVPAAKKKDEDDDDDQEDR